MEAKISSSLKALSILVLFVLLFNGCKDTDSSEKSDSNVEKIIKEEKSDIILEIKSIEDAKKCVVGTWQFTQGWKYWEKYEAKADGSFKSYSAQPRDGKWTEENYGTWTVGTDRYVTNGKKYYYVEFKDSKKGALGIASTYRYAFQKPDVIYNSNLDDLGSGVKTTKSAWD